MNTTKKQTFAGMTEAERKSAKKIARNTWRYTRADGAEVIRLHNTDVVWTLNGETTFHSGGYRTVTTKDRMNLNGQGYKVYSVRGSWQVNGVPFYDGLTLPRDAGTAKVERVAKEEKELNAAIRKFCNLLLDDKKPIPKPGSGDCLFCQLQAGTPAAQQRGQPGDRTGGKDYDTGHLLEHIREGYMHGSLILNAMRWAGFGPAWFSLIFSEPRFYHANRKQLARTLRRYLKFQLGTGEAR